ncbi:hypothetical protein ATCC90586_009033 [Pythium insidiosum]|nr:hypothetical protein ATCC90586_009033 [Pythium insidiosum]
MTGAAPMARAPAATRFCWRERTERLNWRMLKNLHVVDVLRRGDPTLLEPYALHVTFARLPVTVAALAPSRADERVGDGVADIARYDERNAWFLVRVLQLAMEYLLFLRVRDGAVLDTLREELTQCEAYGAFCYYCSGLLIRADIYDISGEFSQRL